MARKEEKPVPKEDRQERFTREILEADRRKYRAYLLTLSERDRERLWVFSVAVADSPGTRIAS